MKGEDISEEVSVVTSVSLRGAAAQPAATAWSIVRRLHAVGRLGRVICPDFAAPPGGPPASSFRSPGARSVRLVSSALARLGRRLPVAERRWREELFDWQVARSGAWAGSESVLFLKPVFPRAAAAARRQGLTVFALATIHHPEFNFERVAREQARRGIARPTSYTDARRVRNVSVFLDSIDFLLTRSPGSERTYRERGMPPQAILPVGETGVDCEVFRPEPARRTARPFRVLHVSHMNLIKGLGYLFQAWRALSLPDAELVLGGAMDEDVRQLLAEIDPPNVVRLGPLRDPRAEYQRAHVFVSPSISDMGPATVLEAMACGTPVIVSDACGVSGILSSGRDGFVYPYDRIDALEQALRAAYDDREALAEMGRAARETALRNARSDWSEGVVAAIDEGRRRGAPQRIAAGERRCDS